MPDSSRLAYENQQVLTLVQAMLGAISPNMRAVTLQCIGSCIHLYFVLKQDCAVDREEIEGIATEFEALQERGIKIEIHVSVNTEPWPKGVGSLPGRPAYVRRAM